MNSGRHSGGNRRVEKLAATIFGFIQFEFARLDTALGLCIAWTNRGSNHLELIARFNASNIHKKLQLWATLMEALCDECPET